MRGDIQDWAAALESRCNWSWLNAAFPRTLISVSDVDFLIERNGHFLIGEVKPHQDQIRQGQHLTFKALASMPEVTAFYLVGDIREHEITPRQMLVCGENVWTPVDRPTFFNFVAGWFRRVDNMPEPMQ